VTSLGTPQPSPDLTAAVEANPHLEEHLRDHREESGEFPLFVDAPDDDHDVRHPNVIYRTGEGTFSHVYGDTGRPTVLHCVEPTLDPATETLYDRLRERLLDVSASRPAPTETGAFTEHIDDLLSELVVVGETTGLRDRAANLVRNRVSVTDDQFRRLRYRFQRDIVGLGALEPVMRDAANEDVHVIGPHQCYVDHGVFGMLPTTVDFGTTEAFDGWLRNLGERMDSPISDSHPIVDSTLPDGSRINIVYSDDVSIEGPSLTIRQGEEVPLSILQITKWGTLSPELAAYLWLCLENERTVFVVGETASGKTTTLNAAMSFIPRDAKIYTAEDTAEVQPPHDTWQRLLTREGTGDHDGVDLFDLVAAALRSRPEYIIVGEVRGREAQMAFQAAQTGHPVMLTFHASDIVSMVQRFTSEPINIPVAFMDNCDVALFQNRVKQGDDVLRRVTSVQEIEGYSEAEGGVVTREVFSWDAVEDEVVFQGMNNSYVLEEQIATLLGYEDTRDIYDELRRRAAVVRRLIDADILGYHEVNEAIETVQRDGVEQLPIDVAGLTRSGGV
jgi:flagellar protein FlaI